MEEVGVLPNLRNNMTMTRRRN